MQTPKQVHLGTEAPLEAQPPGETREKSQEAMSQLFLLLIMGRMMFTPESSWSSGRGVSEANTLRPARDPLPHLALKTAVLQGELLAQELCPNRFTPTSWVT